MSRTRAPSATRSARPIPKKRSVRMYFDRRLWELTRGLRGRIGLAILLGLCGSGFGIARVALLGILLARVFTGADLGTVSLLAAGVAVAVLLRGLCDHARTLIAHQNAG